jgi:rare lipoprotein A
MRRSAAWVGLCLMLGQVHGQEMVKVDATPPLPSVDAVGAVSLVVDPASNVAVLEAAPLRPDVKPDGQSGWVSWYGALHQRKTLHNRKTASGQQFDRDALTAAHRTWPMGTQVLIRNPSNQKEVVVSVNDRGPRSPKRMLDVSRSAAVELGMVQQGVARLWVQRLP